MEQNKIERIYSKLEFQIEQNKTEYNRIDQKIKEQNRKQRKIIEQNKIE